MTKKQTKRIITISGEPKSGKTTIFRIMQKQLHGFVHRDLFEIFEKKSGLSRKNDPDEFYRANRRIRRAEGGDYFLKRLLLEERNSPQDLIIENVVTPDEMTYLLKTQRDILVSLCIFVDTPLALRYESAMEARDIDRNMHLETYRIMLDKQYGGTMPYENNIKLMRGCADIIIPRKTPNGEQMQDFEQFICNTYMPKIKLLLDIPAEVLQG